MSSRVPLRKLSAEQDIHRRERALERLMKEKGHTDTGVIEACIELCDSLNGEALKSLHSEEPEEAMVSGCM